MWLVLDLIVIAIVVFFAILSAKRGFVRTLIEIVGFILVIVLANSVSPILSNYTYDNLLEPSIIKSVEGIEIEGSSVQIPEKAIPDFVYKVLGEDFSLSGFEAVIQQNISSGVETAVATASQTVIKPVVTSLLNIIFTLIIVTVLLIVVNILANIINKFFSFSVIGKVNKTLGGILGVIKGIIIAAVICSIIALIVPLTEDGFLIFTDTNINSSYIFKLLCLSL